MRSLSRNKPVIFGGKNNYLTVVVFERLQNVPFYDTALEFIWIYRRNCVETSAIKIRTPEIRLVKS